VETRDVRAAAYAWLEHALYPGDTGPLPWAPTRRKVDDVEDALRSIVLVDSAASAPAWTNGRTDPPADETVAMRNGLLHIPSRTLLPHTPAHFSHFALSFPYLPNAPEPRRWLTFLRQLWPDDESSIAALQEVLGYVLGGDTRQQKLFLLVGPKRAGKGTIARVVTGLLGSHNVAAPTLASLSTNFGLQPLVGKPLAVVSDARLSGKADGAVVVERLLSISGEDSLTIDRKYRDPWTGRLPVSRPRSGPMLRRTSATLVPPRGLPGTSGPGRAPHSGTGERVGRPVRWLRQGLRAPTGASRGRASRLRCAVPVL
jgi:putative DNA primase/helicase